MNVDNKYSPNISDTADGNSSRASDLQTYRCEDSRKKKKKKIRTVAFIAAIVVFAAALMMLFYTLGRASVMRQEDDMMQGLSDKVHTLEGENPDKGQRPVVSTDNLSEENPDVYSNYIAYNEPGDFEKMLPQYAPLYAENNDMFGWIKIDGTRIDYPVMFSPDDPEKYLHTDFLGNYAYSGTPFLDAKSSCESDQLLVYAHNMNNGTMFRDLLKYEDQEFWKEHPIIRFDTVYEQYDFEVMAVVYDKVYYKTDDCFKFYQFIDAEDQTVYDEAVNYYKENSIYDTGVTARYGDQLLALVTCSYHTEDGRLVVIAKKVNSDS